MSLWKYLKERKLYFILVIFILLIVDITLFLDPNLSESIDTLIYINMLSILTTIIFIIMGYSRYKRELNQFIHNIKENSNMEDNYIDKEIKSIIEEKKEEVDSLRNELEEINDYMTNWIHEVKIPISVLQMIGKRINEVDSSREISKQINSQVSRIDKLVEQAMYSSR
ncbi:MAG: sensor histidine kinase, partial [Clostridium sp.]|nr:sensor histidine kinase [Clostridium sp.]